MASLKMAVVRYPPACCSSSLPRPASSVIPSPPLPLSPDSSSSSSSSSRVSGITRSVFSRSWLALLGSLPLQEFLATSQPAYAFSLGISGPKEWLKDQKKKTAAYLLAPINASRERLKTAVSFAETASPGDIAEAQKLVKSAARDCMKPEDGSLVALQVKTGVEVCTFRLILKNAASLLDDADPVKLNANVALNNLISSFTSLDGMLTQFSMDTSSSRNSVTDAFGQTSAALDIFERSVRECLGVA